MRMFPVSGSSNIDAIGYDAPARELRVAFRANGTGDPRTYAYADVPADVAGALFGSNSIGSAFAQIVRPRFKAVLVDPPPPPSGAA